MNHKAAILGGTPMFDQPLPFAMPTLPPYSELEDGFRSIIESGMVTKGKYLEQYERALEQYLEVPHALGVSSCTIGLYMLIKALGLKGEVIVPSFSFMATFHVLDMSGITPIFVDCERDTLTIDPKRVEDAITSKTTAIIGVNIFGNPPDLKALEEIAKRRGLKFIMDSAHSFGTLYYGKPMGSHGDGEVFSTSATKLLATGEGGAVTTNNKNTRDFIEKFREYGNCGNYDCAEAGVNGRMSEFHAYLGLKTLPNLEDYAEARNRIAKFYREEITGTPGILFQKIRDGCRSSYKDFVIIVDEHQFGLNRDQLSKALEAEKIGTRKYFYPPGHRQTVYKKYEAKYASELVNTDYISTHTLNLPMYSHMTIDQASKVAEAIERIYRCRDEISKIIKNEMAAQAV